VKRLTVEWEVRHGNEDLLFDDDHFAEWDADGRPESWLFREFWLPDDAEILSVKVEDA
jgi:hypothetical protein